MLLSAKGFTEGALRWEISLPRLYAYLHAARVIDRVEMMWPSACSRGDQDQRKAWARFEKHRALTRGGTWHA